MTGIAEGGCTMLAVYHIMYGKQSRTVAIPRLATGLIPSVRFGSAARDMRRDGEPLAVLARPYVGVAAGARASVSRRVAGAGVDDRHIAEQANLDIMHG